MNIINSVSLRRQWEFVIVTPLKFGIEMVSEETTGLKVEKLHGDNYHNWKFQMKMHLMAKDVWEIVTGDEILPEEASQAERGRFRKRENLALATVCLSVVTGLQIYVRSADIAKEAWESLEQHFEKKSLSQKIYYRRKLYAARMDTGASMLEHVNYIETLSEHLQAVGDPITEKDLVIILVRSLPEIYNYLITALETTAEERLTWNYVRDRLVHEDEKMHGGSAECKTNAALLSKGSRYKEIIILRKERAITVKRMVIMPRTVLRRKQISEKRETKVQPNQQTE